MRSAPACAASSKTILEPSTLIALVASLAERIANAKCTTTSAPFTASRTLAASCTSPCLYSVFFQPALAGSNGRRAMPMIRLTRRERSSSETSAIPRSPVGPVTATVSWSVGISGLARQDDLGGVLLDDDARHHRLHVAAARRLERMPDRLELGQLLEVLDGGEDEAELTAAIGVKSVDRPHPAQVHALLAVAARLRSGRRLGDEEVGVEADLRLLRRDPARERDEGLGVRERQAGLLLELAPARLGGAAVLAVHRSAGEHPGAAHEALGRVALHEQHLGTLRAVPQNDHRRGRPRLGHLPGIQLLPVVRRAVDPAIAFGHPRQPTLANLPESWKQPHSNSGSASPAGSSTTPPRAIPTGACHPAPRSRKSRATGSARSAAPGKRTSRPTKGEPPLKPCAGLGRSPSATAGRRGRSRYAIRASRARFRCGCRGRRSGSGPASCRPPARCSPRARTGSRRSPR